MAATRRRISTAPRCTSSTVCWINSGRPRNEAPYTEEAGAARAGPSLRSRRCPRPTLSTASASCRASGATQRVLEGHSGGVTHVVPLDRDRVLSASSDYTLRLWDLATG
jgi:WD40 repeat protein